MYQLLEKYPYATDVVRQWFMEKMIESFKDQSVPQDFKDFMRKQGIPNENIVKILDGNSRALFDVFDDNNLIISVVHTENGFTWDVNHVKNISYYSSRKEAELAAVERAFQILDDKLNIIISETPNDEGQDSTTSGE